MQGHSLSQAQQVSFHSFKYFFTMAWRCSGRTNAELISNMSKSGIFHSEQVAQVSTAFVAMPLRVPNIATIDFTMAGSLGNDER